MSGSVIVGPGDDAGVFSLQEGNPLVVETVDIITPLVNDPFTFGSVSAANSLSDVYAMGGVPHTALALLGYSSCDFDLAVIKLILAGACDVLRKAGVSLIGGHSFDDPELKFGLSVMGTVKKDALLRAKGARPGDVLILTKPLGIGILSTALKARKNEDMSPAVEAMLTLNDKASASAVSAGAHAATDVTGFGLLGHAYNMARGSDTDFEIRVSGVPVMERVREFVEGGIIPEGAHNNLKFLEGKIDPGDSTEDERIVLADPQTSGGLLIALPIEGIGKFKASGVGFSVIGKVVPGTGRIRLA